MTGADRAEFLRVVRLSRAHLDRSLPFHLEGESDQELFERHLRLAAAPSHGPDWRRIAVLPGGRIVGGVNLNRITRGLVCRAEANWWISADATGRGYATESVCAMLQHALSDLPAGLGLHRIDALIAPDNARSIRIAERAGLRLNRQSPRIPLSLAGRGVDHDVYTRYAEPASAAAPALAPAVQPRLMTGGLRRVLAVEPHAL